VTETICGVDVCGDWLDACVNDIKPAFHRFPRTSEGIAELAELCRQRQVGLVVMEATGGYEKLPFALLWAVGVPAAIVNPRAVRRFAEAMGLLEKTDRIDASVIAHYAAVKGVAAQLPAPATQQRLTALVTRLRQLTDLRVAQTNQRRLVTDADVLASFTAVLAVVNGQIRDLAAKIAALLGTDPLWRALDREFRSIKGVADRTVASLMAILPEIGTLPNKAITKLVGYAPLARDSGKHTGRRPVRAGRAAIRSILFVVARCVQQHNADFAAFARRLADAGKPKKVIRVAVAHKLLVRLNAKARDVRQQLAKAA
jgi:transposase